MNLHNARTIAEFSNECGISRTTVYAQIKAGRLTARKLGRRTVILPQDAERFLADLPVMGSTPPVAVGKPSKAA